MRIALILNRIKKIKNMSGIPDRWLSYKPMGELIPGTRFICFKVPLKQTLCDGLQDNERFTPEMLMEQCPKLGLVVDLTNTRRYYNGEVFMSRGIRYKKIHCPGHVIPAGRILKEFFSTVDAFLNESDEQDKLVGVHCTHGLNRTGYFICRYLNLRMGFEAKDAISAFEKARGYKIEREPYIQDIVSGKGVGEESIERKGESRETHNGPMSGRGNPYGHPDRRRQHSTSRDNRHHQSHHDLAPPNSFYPPQPPVSRRNSLVSESPLSNSYDDYVAPSRYSRGYGDTARGGYGGGKMGHQGRPNPRYHPFENANQRQNRGPQEPRKEYNRSANSPPRGRDYVQKHNTHQARHSSVGKHESSRPREASNNSSRERRRRDDNSYR